MKADLVDFFSLSLVVKGQLIGSNYQKQADLSND
jgi:hypothetical protein